MPRVIKNRDAVVSSTRLPTGEASFAAYLTGADFRSGLRGVGVRSLEPEARLEPADIGDVEEVWFVIAGVGALLCDGVESPIQPGDVVYTGPGERRGLRNTGLEPLVFMSFAADVPRR